MTLVSLFYIDQLSRDLKTPRRALYAAFIPAAVGCLALATTLLTVRHLLRREPTDIVFAAAMVSGLAAYALVVWTLSRHQLIADAQAFASAQQDGAPPDSPEPANAGSAELTPAA
jgi:hypothetical protein